MEVRSEVNQRVGYISKLPILLFVLIPLYLISVLKIDKLWYIIFELPPGEI